MDKKKGYLNEDFQLFHLKDKKSQSFEFHYHDFNKIIIFISGKVTYLIEGKAYELRPWDILLVNNHDVHKPIIDSKKTYERIIIWANSEFIEKHNYDNCNLANCFEVAKEKSFNLVRLKNEFKDNIKFIINSLEESIVSEEFGSKLLSNSLFMQLIVYLNRVHLAKSYLKDKDTFQYDKQIEKILKYINTNLNNDLSIENIAQRFFISKYYLMHKFKKETGYTVHNYVLQKRLLLSKDMIKDGETITKTYLQCGFKDYSSYFRAFKKLFGKSPRDFCNNI
ncbi:AraC family transcriptional regulator [Clostridium felsineum]|uniref:AraC family transcriptional regulator n=1 Tax=Clostridium felsineum TaxID=36839 RepID=UPI00098C6BCB|nr:AraC family transcriptional regulator [Clostridium felsineum]URZ15098.1 HTH-type transcriptional activator RhaS [Clostridium felsineum DSM 794]